MAVKLAKPKKSKSFKQVPENDFFKSLAKIKLVKKIAVAVSGGPDSLALTILLNKFSSLNNARLYAISIDHGLRSSSNSELKWLASEMKKRKINHKIIKWKDKKPTSNILSNARDKRYKLLIEECNKLNIKYLFTGHHLDDQVENMLLRLIRGSGIKGLASLQAEFKFTNSKVKILRPLLPYPKKSLISYLANEKQEYIIDPTNFNSSHDRSRIRKVTSHLVEEGLTNIRLLNTFKYLKEANNSINYLINTSIKNFIKVDQNGLVSLSINKFSPLPAEIKFRSLSKILSFIGKNKNEPRSKSILNLLNKITAIEFTNTTLSNCLILKQKKLIFFLPETSRQIKSTKIKLDNFIWNDQYKITMKKNHTKGLSIRYLGLAAAKKMPKKYSEGSDQRTTAALVSIWKDKKLLEVPTLGYKDTKNTSVKKIDIIDIYSFFEER